jgi:hypothetical protein
MIHRRFFDVRLHGHCGDGNGHAHECKVVHVAPPRNTRRDSGRGGGQHCGRRRRARRCRGAGGGGNGPPPHDSWIGRERLGAKSRWRRKYKGLGSSGIPGASPHQAD